MLDYASVPCADGPISARDAGNVQYLLHALLCDAALPPRKMLASPALSARSLRSGHALCGALDWLLRLVAPLSPFGGGSRALTTLPHYITLGLTAGGS